MRTTSEVADIFGVIFSKPAAFEHYNAAEKRVMRAVARCRTAALGGHVRQCEQCGHREQAYNSCLNRHCPKCRGGDAFNWLQARSEELLPVPYFHLVFTLPQELSELCKANRKIFYNILFQASSETLLQVSRNNLKLKIGFFAVLHTWNQELGFHPHVHYVVPGGGLSTETNAWQTVPGKDKFFLPVRILSRVYRGKFIAYLKANYSKLFFAKKISEYRNPQEFEHLLSQACKHDWVVYAKRPFAGPETVLKYLAGYTHRVGISNKRILSVAPDRVTFVARAKKDPSKKRLIQLTPEVFTRRFMQHLLPKAFRRIRYYGFLSQNQKTAVIRAIRADLEPPTPQLSVLTPSTCALCKSSSLRILSVFKAHSAFEQPHVIPSLPFLCGIPLCLSPPAAVL